MLYLIGLGRVENVARCLITCFRFFTFCFFLVFCHLILHHYDFATWVNLFEFLAELSLLFDSKYFWSWNLMRTTCRRHADNMQMMCRWHANDVWMTREQDFRWDFDWWMTYVIQMSSGHHPQAGMSSTGRYVIHTLSAALLMVSIDLNYLSTVTGTCYWMEFVTRMLSCFISGSCKWFAR